MCYFFTCYRVLKSYPSSNLLIFWRVFSLTVGQAFHIHWPTVFCILILWNCGGSVTAWLNCSFAAQWMEMYREIAYGFQTTVHIWEPQCISRGEILCFIGRRVRLQFLEVILNPWNKMFWTLVVSVLQCCGSRRTKMTQKNRKQLINFIFWSSGCSLLRVEGFSCSLDVFYEGVGISKFKCFIKKRFNKNVQLYFFNFWSSNPDPYPDSLEMLDLDPYPGPYSMNPDPQYWWLAKIYFCKSWTSDPIITIFWICGYGSGSVWILIY